MQNRTLFFGDNLQILREKITENSFDLIYLDPPFNSNRNYNVLFSKEKIDSSAQIRAFTDTWEWTPETENIFEQLLSSSNPNIALLTNSLKGFVGNQTPVLAYLVNMIIRLELLRKALKPTGSLYLHCDPTASHYLKIVLDVIFGKENFRNEIIWTYRRWPSKSKVFQRMHDIILFYTKDVGSDYTFNPPYQPLADITLKIHKGKKQKVVMLDGQRFSKDQEEESSGTPIPDYWYIPTIAGNSHERLGYPTQKPEELLRRIILASTNKGDWILDPFCGCGTTMSVAEEQKRNWVGIDISMMAINVITKRLKDHYGKNLTLHFDGLPQDIDGAEKLAEENKFTFQDWAITLIGALPPEGETRKGADRGVDGLYLFKQIIDSDIVLKKAIVQVKTGHVNRGDIATFKADIKSRGAVMGVFITLRPPTAEMVREASEAGFYRYSETEKYPTVQILSISDWFEGKISVKLPSGTVNPFKKAKNKADPDQSSLFN